MQRIAFVSLGRLVMPGQVFVGALLWFLLPPATAVTVLTAQLTDVTCQIARPSGVQAVQCVTLDSGIGHERVGFAGSLAPGEAAEVRGSLDYQYSDDGLPLIAPVPIQLDANGSSALNVDHEAGALYATSVNCSGSRACQVAPGVSLGGNTGFPPLVLGFNDTADRLSGRIPVSGSVSVSPDAGSGERRDVFVGWVAIANSGVSPIPEPSTALLLFGGLVLLASTRMRRNDRRSFRGTRAALASGRR